MNLKHLKRNVNIVNNTNKEHYKEKGTIVTDINLQTPDERQQIPVLNTYLTKS